MDLSLLIQSAGENKGLLAGVFGSLATGYISAMVIPPADVAVFAFRLTLKFPPVLWAVKKNPQAFKAMFDAAEQALDKVVDEVSEPQPKPVEPPKP